MWNEFKIWSVADQRSWIWYRRYVKSTRQHTSLVNVSTAKEDSTYLVLTTFSNQPGQSFFSWIIAVQNTCFDNHWFLLLRTSSDNQLDVVLWICEVAADYVTLLQDYVTLLQNYDVIMSFKTISCESVKTLSFAKEWPLICWNIETLQPLILPLHRVVS